MTGEKAEKAAELQERLQNLLDDLIEKDYELGAQVAIYWDGELAVDVCAGTVSSKTNQKVEPNTIFPVCSTGKGVLATIIHRLAEQGLIDYQARVADYWPEFGCNGKESVTVTQALCHQAGIPQMPAFVSLEEALDFDAACDRLAKMTPDWEPGSKMQYHSRSWGWLIGGLAQKAAKKPLQQLLRDEVTHPLGIDDVMYFGVDDDGDRRFSEFEVQPTAKEQISTAAITNVKSTLGGIPELKLSINDCVNLPVIRRSCMPAFNGAMSARAIAKHYAAVIGEVDGVRLIPEDRMRTATTRVTEPGTTPECFGHGFGLGYCLKGAQDDMGSFFGHGGAGGSEGMVNRRAGWALGITKNRMDTHLDASDHTTRLVVGTIHEIIGNEGDGGFYSSSDK